MLPIVNTNFPFLSFIFLLPAMQDFTEYDGIRRAGYLGMSLFPPPRTVRSRRAEGQRQGRRRRMAEIARYGS